MAFSFSWNNFSRGFVENAEALLTSALNKGPKPAIICDVIAVEELRMGSTAPELELVELGEIGEEEFRGTFRLKYAGDAHLVIRTKVQANPLLGRTTHALPFSPVQMVAADAPLTVPMFLRLSDMQLDGSVILLFTAGGGLSMVFRNDPLRHVLVTSTFDSIAAIRTFLQSQIERKLRQLICDELPSIVQQLSTTWMGGRRGLSPRVRATELDFAIPPMTMASPYMSSYPSFHHASYAGSSGSSGRTTAQNSQYSTPGSLPHLYRNQSFTGRGGLTPFTPAIAQAIYKSTQLSALDLAERQSQRSVSASSAGSTASWDRSTLTGTSGRRRRKKHSVISLRKEVAKEEDEDQSQSRKHTPPKRVVSSYFDSDSPMSEAGAPVEAHVNRGQEDIHSRERWLERTVSRELQEQVEKDEARTTTPSRRALTPGGLHAILETGTSQADRTATSGTVDKELHYFDGALRGSQRRVPPPASARTNLRSPRSPGLASTTPDPPELFLPRRSPGQSPRASPRITPLQTIHENRKSGIESPRARPNGPVSARDVRDFAL
ncbi:NADH dehydrogenase 1 alpha subcomplex subunit 13 ndufa13/GRIM19 [Savitreella phatthalungensis]